MTLRFGTSLPASGQRNACSDPVHGLSPMIAAASGPLGLSGGAAPNSTVAQSITVGAFWLGVDFLVFHQLLTIGAGIAAAHIASFALATIFTYILHWRTFAEPAHVRRKPAWHVHLRFLAVCLLAVFLRGGVLATAMSVLGWRPEIALVPSSAAAALVVYAGSALFVLPSLNSRWTRTVRWRTAALAVLTYVVAVRLVFMGPINLLPEEAYYWNYAQHLDMGYLDHPPMVAWLIWLGTTVFGPSEFAMRLGAVLCWLIAALFSFQLAHDLYGKTAAFVAVLLFSALPFFFTMGFLILPDAPLTAAWAGTLYFLGRATLAEHQRAWLGVGVCMGLGLLSKYTIGLLGLATLILLLLDPNARRWFWSPWPCLAAVIALLLFSPVIAWNAAHDWASFAFQSMRRLNAAPKFSLHLLVGSIVLMITPVGLAAVVSGFIPSASNRRLSPHSIDRIRVFIAVYTLAPLSVFVAFSLFHRVKLNWTGPLWLAALPAIGQMIATRSGPGVLQRRTAWSATIAIVLVVYGAGFHYLAHGLPGVPYPADLRMLPIAWREFGDAAAEIEVQVEATTGHRPLLVGMDPYFLSSELAFYRRHKSLDAVQSTAGQGLFGSKGLMYDNWFARTSQSGRTVIMFGSDPWVLSGASLSKWFRELGPITERIMFKGDTPAGRFYYRVGHDFRP
jgi:dolichol-phosphate mannosyltransferase